MLSVDNKRLKESIINAHISANIMNILSMEKYRIAIKPKFETACWYYDYISESNNIYIGDGIFERIEDNYNDVDKIVMSYLVHEVAHSIYTSKDLVALKKKLQAEKLQFQLYNLFEDARIEHKIREYFGFTFDWIDFEGIPEDSPIEKASTTLFKIIQTEDRHYFDVPYYEKVKKYYDKIVSAKNEDEMIKIMVEWVKDFPNDSSPEHNKNMSQGQGQEQESQNNQGQGQGQGQDGKDKDKQEQGQEQGQEQDEKSDLELASELQENPDLADEFGEDANVVIGDAKQMLEELANEIDKDAQSNVKYLEEVKADVENLSSSNTQTIFTEQAFNESKIYPEKLQDAEDKLKRILKSLEIENINTSSHDKRFNIKGVIQALSGSVNAKPYKKSVEESLEEQKKKVFILMDGSGSMSGLPQKNMLTFAIVVNRLASIDLFEGWIGGSKVESVGSVSQALKLPVSDGFITSFRADANAEGIGYAMLLHKDKMKEADYIFVLTDGQIHDKDLTFIKKSEPELYNKTLGVYMGERAYANRKYMDLWFKNSIIEPKFENVVERVVELLDPKSDAYQKINEIEMKENEKQARIDDFFSHNTL